MLLLSVLDVDTLLRCSSAGERAYPLAPQRSLTCDLPCAVVHGTGPGGTVMAASAGQVSTESAASGVDAQPKLKRNEVGLLGSTVFARAGAAPGQTVSIVLATLVVTSAYGT